MILQIKLTADATGADRAVAAFSKRAGAYVGSIGSELKSQLAGAFAAGAVIAAVRSFGAHVVETVDNIKDMSEQLGVSTDEIQRMQKAANDAGVKFTVISGALQRIDQLRAQAAGGDKAASGLFAGLGIDPNVGTSLDILRQAVKASFGTAQQQAAYASLFAKKANQMRVVVAELQAQGPIELISEGQIQRIDQANAKLEESKRRLTALSAGPAAFLTGVLERGIGGYLNIGKGLGKLLGSEFGKSPTDAEKSEGLKRILAGAFSVFGGALFGGKMNDKMLASLGIANASGTSAALSGITPQPSSAQAAAIAASTPAASAISLGQPGDSLSRIGLFVGGRPEVRSLASIERNTAEAARSSSQALRTLKAIEEGIMALGGQI